MKKVKVFVFILALTLLIGGIVSAYCQSEKATLEYNMDFAVSAPVYGHYKNFWGYNNSGSRTDMWITADYLSNGAYVNDYSTDAYLCPGCSKGKTSTVYLSNETYWRVWLQPKSALAGDATGWGRIECK